MKIYKDEVRDGQLDMTWAGKVIGFIDSYLNGLLIWRWVALKLGFEFYCPRCGGCGYVDCCGLKCDQGFCCAHYYSDRECIKVKGVQRCIPYED